MDKSRPRAMDITAPRRSGGGSRGWQLPRKQITSLIISTGLLLGIIASAYWYAHRNDQRIMGDQYQVVYLLSGQVYFGKLQNTTGDYLTLTNVFMLQGQQGEETDAENTSNILQVSRQVYGPDDSMAIRADQVQFWQNLRPDSKVVQAIESANK